MRSSAAADPACYPRGSALLRTKPFNIIYTTLPKTPQKNFSLHFPPLPRLPTRFLLTPFLPQTFFEDINLPKIRELN
jgi:hypothetical protein